MGRIWNPEKNLFLKKDKQGTVSYKAKTIRNQGNTGRNAEL